ncbi:HlyD family type I secretion periplasmic adaptor subunit [Acinetobacter sp. ANC 4173]|jgi:adhesin transport system membrane fusion protein|uniref:HlyD family type I secretion periplasmic adaptor subunit n=1 Tax=Acinetobacter sp. ANC 4173 TaxID=2529837 RepID=UPI00103C8E1B|nr:HlyD family type I secretion periplasmic adaptor subunit [Acinetobacter sp. ANC 4173]TCB77742.1 HlyD family type I secretion periplasmic adaptor subunit [Acinetobacter sp. ANC 4173]
MSKHDKIQREKLFDSVGRGIEHSEKLWMKVLGRLGLFKNKPYQDLDDWQSQIQEVTQSQTPVRARGILYLIVLIFFVLLIWSAFATIDEITKGEGKVIPSQQMQVIQSVDGGVVEKVYVQEGEHVKKGDLLVRIDPTRFVSNLNEVNAKIFALQTKVKRLTAQVSGATYASSAVPEGVSPSEAAQILTQESQYYSESLRELSQRTMTNQGAVSTRQGESQRAQAALAQAERAYQMAVKELNTTRPLIKTGAVSEMDLLRLERDVSNADGERKQAAANLRASQSSIGEAQSRTSEAAVSLKNQWRNELAEAQAQLVSLKQSISGVADRVKTTDIRSPANGIVQKIFFNTIGGVVKPSDQVAEIVPVDGQLIVEAKVSPKDIAFIRPGLPAVIKFNAYDFSIYGGMEAKVKHISPDTFTDEKGNTYYIVRAVTDRPTFGRNLSVIPGMTVQLDIMTGKKSILSYLLKPILKAKSNALTER